MATTNTQKDLKIMELLQASASGEYAKLNSFIDLALDLKGKQEALDIMATDTLPSAIITAYVSDILEPNENGDLIQVVANTTGEQAVISNIYDRLNIPAQKVIYSLLKNGIAILRFSKQKDTKVKKSATEDILVEKPGRILPQIEVMQDTFTVFPILEKERCIGYIEILNKDTTFDSFNWSMDILTYSDVVIHSPQDFVYVKFGVSKSSRPLTLKIKNQNGGIDSYTVDVGCSLLENSYAAWKTLSILQDSIVLASLIKNAQFMLIQTEAGSASKQQIEAAKVQMKNLFEGKLTMGQNGIKQYLSPQSKPAFIYTFTQGGKGAISAQLIGGEYNPGNLYYLTPFVNQFFAGMNVPKQNFGYTEGAGGLDGGGAVEEYTKRYKSTVALFKRLYAELVTKAINAVLNSRGIKKLVDSFSVKVHRAYQEVDNTVIQKYESQLRLYESTISFLGITDEHALLELKMTMLKQVFTDKAMLTAFETAIAPKPKETDTDKDEPQQGDEDMLSPEGDDLEALLGEDDSKDTEIEETEIEETEMDVDAEVANTTLPEMDKVLDSSEV